MTSNLRNDIREIIEMIGKPGTTFNRRPNTIKTKQYKKQLDSAIKKPIAHEKLN